jgi:hypothetical protein
LISPSLLSRAMTLLRQKILLGRIGIATASPYSPTGTSLEGPLPRRRLAPPHPLFIHCDLQFNSSVISVIVIRVVIVMLGDFSKQVEYN